MVPRRALHGNPRLPAPPRTTKAEQEGGSRFLGMGMRSWERGEGSGERSLWVLRLLHPAPFFPAASGNPSGTESVERRGGRGLRKFPENGKATAGWWKEVWRERGREGLSRKRVSQLTVSLSFKGNSLAWAPRPSAPLASSHSSIHLSIHPPIHPCVLSPPDSVLFQFLSFPPPENRRLD